MKPWILMVVFSVIASVVVAAPAKPVPSAPLKAYVGPEGQVIVLVEANDSKQMLVFFKNVDNTLDGTTLLYDYDGTTVFTMKKRGSKTYRSIMLTSDGDGAWEFTNPIKTSIHFTIGYSRQDSEHFKVDEVLAAYHP